MAGNMKRPLAQENTPKPAKMNVALPVDGKTVPKYCTHNKNMSGASHVITTW